MTVRKIRNMEEFAAASGLSRPTVSKYFNDPDSVRSSTRRRIEAALETHDYRPNIFAMNQNRKLTKNIGIVVPFLADPFFAEIARKIEHDVITAGFRPALFSAHGDPELEREVLENLRSLKPAGVLFAPLGRASNRKTIDAFCRDIPTVLFDSNLPDAGIAFVGSDNPQFSRVIVDYLCRSGEAPCFFEMKDPANPNANKRRLAYIGAMESIGKNPNVISVSGDGWDFEEIGRRGGLDAIGNDRFATKTVLCSNDRLAIGLLSACFEKGISVGHGEQEEFRVAGQDDHPFSRYTCPSLTTMAQDYDAISRTATRLLMQSIESGAKPDNTGDVLFEGKLVMRASA
ncbi:MAG: LacI family DNA-binding transcriptional regulator [Pseudomonadota bacterium]